MERIYRFLIHVVRMFCISQLQQDWKEVRLARVAASCHIYGDYSLATQRDMYWLWWGFDYIGIKQKTRNRL